MVHFIYSSNFSHNSTGPDLSHFWYIEIKFFSQNIHRSGPVVHFIYSSIFSHNLWRMCTFAGIANRTPARLSPLWPSPPQSNLLASTWRVALLPLGHHRVSISLAADITRSARYSGSCQVEHTCLVHLRRRIVSLSSTDSPPGAAQLCKWTFDHPA